jgi:acetate kinase
LKIIICHLGTGGASVVAIQNGKSIDTSMGYSPLSGLIMSTRCGDIDPMLGIYLMNVYGYRSDEVIDLFDRRSGLLGVSGLSSDIRDIIHNTSPEEQEQSDLAFDMYIHRLKKYIGSFCAILGGVDVLAFTDDIGVKNWLVREKACEGMEWCGLKLDREANMAAVPDANSLLSKQESATKIFCIPNDEELVICMEGIKLEQEKCHDANL